MLREHRYLGLVFPVLLGLVTGDGIGLLRAPQQKRVVPEIQPTEIRAGLESSGETVGRVDAFPVNLEPPPSPAPPAP